MQTIGKKGEIILIISLASNPSIRGDSLSIRTKSILWGREEQAIIACSLVETHTTSKKFLIRNIFMVSYTK